MEVQSKGHEAANLVKAKTVAVQMAEFSRMTQL
jgi:hypothetical protein